jgi:hypothetical protein
MSAGVPAALALSSVFEHEPDYDRPSLPLSAKKSCMTPSWRCTATLFQPWPWSESVALLGVDVQADIGQSGDKTAQPLDVDDMVLVGDGHQRLSVAPGQEGRGPHSAGRRGAIPVRRAGSHGAGCRNSHAQSAGRRLPRR